MACRAQKDAPVDVLHRLIVIGLHVLCLTGLPGLAITHRIIAVYLSYPNKEVVAMFTKYNGRIDRGYGNMLNF